MTGRPDRHYRRADNQFIIPLFDENRKLWYDAQSGTTECSIGED